MSNSQQYFKQINPFHNPNVIQELQTIVHHKLPIKILVFNNGSYGAIQITQQNYFKNYFGINNEI